MFSSIWQLILCSLYLNLSTTGGELIRIFANTMKSFALKTHIKSTIFKAMYYGICLAIPRDTVRSIQSGQTISNLLFNNCTCTMSWIDLICRQTLNNIQSIYQSCNVFCKNCLQYRAWARPEAVNQTEYALSVGTEILPYFENYFGIPFPLPKQGISYYLSVCILYFLKKISCYQKIEQDFKEIHFSSIISNFDESKSSYYSTFK